MPPESPLIQRVRISQDWWDLQDQSELRPTFARRRERSTKASPFFFFSLPLKTTRPDWRIVLPGSETSHRRNIFVCGHRLCKDQGITWVVLALLVPHLIGNQTGVLQLPSWALYPLSYSHIVIQVVKNYSFNLRISKTMLQASCQSWLYSCFLPYLTHIECGEVRMVA